MNRTSHDAYMTVMLFIKMQLMYNKEEEFDQFMPNMTTQEKKYIMTNLDYYKKLGISSMTFSNSTSGGALFILVTITLNSGKIQFQNNNLQFMALNYE
ncbi:UNKNOWN [Stylonychia lemnae]|uniref:Uncharacterized protein n=1 Tax=Stylonychia lemnae TaxID=5949 RepID=A0A077ZYX2_STYLE|nr:UNKNOWN [Stylonychia lemnae]|eukprot:CDW74358.1 UNKNOWN [Stylonychia lemnae]